MLLLNSANLIIIDKCIYYVLLDFMTKVLDNCTIELIGVTSLENIIDSQYDPNPGKVVQEEG